ncbi:MAG: DNA-binding protein [Acidobacteria bacterium]|nr:MAG: DNA-binding protein [Acidobacteriota bacterium]
MQFKQVLLCLSLVLFSTRLIAAETLKGEILKTQTAGGYTYILLKTDSEDIWVATMEIPVKKGQTVELKSGMVMKNFESKSLNRVFDRIVFSSGLVSSDNGLHSHGGVYHSHDANTDHTHSHQSDSEDPIAALSKGTWKQKDHQHSVEKHSEADSYTVEELYRKGKELNLRTVRVKGKVTKVLSQIMNKNWIHLQDGTGNPSQGTHDLVVTSQELPKVGDVVSMAGTLYYEKDFGSGYSYKVIVEEASIVK